LNLSYAQAGQRWLDSLLQKIHKSLDIVLHKFMVAQRAMERAMLGDSLRDRFRNEMIHQRSNWHSPLYKNAERWQWASHITRLTTVGVNESWCGDRKRSVGCPQARRSDDLRKTSGRSWMRVAEDWARWRAIEEAYVQQWTVMGWWWWWWCILKRSGGGNLTESLCSFYSNVKSEIDSDILTITAPIRLFINRTSELAIIIIYSNVKATR
jgi:hypothetical protein